MKVFSMSDCHTTGRKGVLDCLKETDGYKKQPMLKSGCLCSYIGVHTCLRHNLFPLT